MTSAQGHMSATQRVIRATECPNVVVGLVALYLAADWTRQALIGKPPSERWVDAHGVLTGITRENRSSAFRLYARGQCVGCGAAVSGDSTGDHIIALDRGGAQNAGNYMPLCQSCNSSKGARDLLDWWVSLERTQPLDPDVLVAYARLEFANRNRTRRTGELAPDALLTVLERARGGHARIDQAADLESGTSDCGAPMTFECALCREPVDPLSQFTYRRIVGWERKATASSRKSGSDIALREPRDEFAHGHCVSLAKQNLAPGQASLM